MNKVKNLEVAKRGLALPETFNLDMVEYNSKIDYYGDVMPEPSDCDAAFCFAGYLAALDGYPSIYINYNIRTYFDYYEYSIGLLGTKSTYSAKAWIFFFSHNWPSVFKDLKERCQYVIDNDGEIPKRFCVEDNDWTGKLNK